MKVKLQWMNKSTRRVDYNTHCNNCLNIRHTRRNVGCRVVMKGEQHIRIAQKEVMGVEGRYYMRARCSYSKEFHSE